MLWDEFKHLYATLFKKSSDYIKVVETLSKKRVGMTREEIAEGSGVNQNGNLTKVLENLEASSFILVYRYFGSKKKNRVYQLSDYYTLFYYKFLKDKAGVDEHFWTNSIANPSVKAWK